MGNWITYSKKIISDAETVLAVGCATETIEDELCLDTFKNMKTINLWESLIFSEAWINGEK